MAVVRIDMHAICDWPSFHAVFSNAIGFPDYYGNNMNAWIDCMSYLNDPNGSDTKLLAGPGEIVVLYLDHMAEFRTRCPEIHDALIEATAFVNRRVLDMDQPPVLALAYSNIPNDRV
jgi:hypothetical protein